MIDLFIKPLITMVLLSNRTSLVIKSPKMLLKRSLVETLFSNLSLNGQDLRWFWVLPLSIVAKNDEYNKWLGWQDSNLRMDITEEHTNYPAHYHA